MIFDGKSRSFSPRRPLRKTFVRSFAALSPALNFMLANKIPLDLSFTAAQPRPYSLTAPMRIIGN